MQLTLYLVNKSSTFLAEEVGSGKGTSEGGRERELGLQIVHYMHDSSSEQSSCHKLHNRG